MIPRKRWEKTARTGMWTCGDEKRGRWADNGEGSWVDRMYARWVNKADASRGDGLIEVTGDVRRGGWIVGDVKCGEVRSMESGVRVDRWGVR